MSSEPREPRFLTQAVEPLPPRRFELVPPPERPARPPCAPQPEQPIETAPATDPPCPLFGIAVSDQDRFIAVAHDNGVVGLWQPTVAAITGLAEPMFVARGHTRSARAVAFEPPGARDYTCLVSGSVDSTIGVWHLGDRTRNTVLRHHESSVMCLAFDAAGTRLVSGSEDCTVAITSWPDGKLERKLTAHKGTVLSVAVSPSGKYVASGGFDGRAFLWSVAGKQIARIDKRTGGWIWNVRFLDDDHIVFSEGSDVVEWTPRTKGRTLYTLRDVAYSVQALAVRGDGAQIAFGDADRVITLDLANRRLKQRLGHDDVVHGVAYLGDGRLASTANDGALLVWGDDDDPDLRLRAASA
ncbi:MAG TPA: WD40 repeat domain-containing protein [Kofleriaceae bacterium]